MSPKSFPSISEDHGIAALQKGDLNVYSIGVSTAGLAEVRMAKLLSQRKIIATTIDQEGAEYSRRMIEKEGVTDQVSIKLEDLRQVLPYKND